MNLLAYGIDHCAEAYSSRAWREERRTRRGFHRELFNFYFWVDSWGNLLDSTDDECGYSVGSWNIGEWGADTPADQHWNGYSMSWARPDD